MKRMIICLIVVLCLAVVSAIALPGHPDRTSNSTWKAIQTGTAMELTALANSSELLPGVSEVPAQPNQR
ncbi:MAG TPA: hypothetical protein VMV04_08295 [Thermodesulfobacteriota bacterium]|nr:hypothetical protein [Thermodesulfobacteriota bacterium]